MNRSGTSCCTSFTIFTFPSPVTLDSEQQFRIFGCPLQPMPSMSEVSNSSRPELWSDIATGLQRAGNVFQDFRKVSSNSSKRINRWWSQTFFNKWIDRNFPGWRAGVVRAIASGIFTFLLNLAFLLYFWITSKQRPNGLVTFHEDDCSKNKTIYVICKVIINLFSTVWLLSVSN